MRAAMADIGAARAQLFTRLELGGTLGYTRSTTETLRGLGLAPTRWTVDRTNWGLGIGIGISIDPPKVRLAE